MKPLFVLRPEPAALTTATNAAHKGLDVRLHPLFRTISVDWEMPPGPFDGLLLTSANAVRHAGHLPDLPVHAVGEATASKAQTAGATVVSVGKGGVDALLASVPENLRLLHLTGEERIAPCAPRQQIESVTVYRTEALPPPEPGSLLDAVLLIHSPAAGRRIADLDLDRSRIAIAAISPAAAAACGEGWQRCEAAPQPSDSALLFLAADLCKDSAP